MGSPCSLACVTVQENSGKQLWHTPRVPIAGLPEKEHWPQAEQLVSLLRCQPGRPVATQVTSTVHGTSYYRDIRLALFASLNRLGELTIAGCDRVMKCNITWLLQG